MTTVQALICALILVPAFVGCGGVFLGYRSGFKDGRAKGRHEGRQERRDEGI